MILVLNLVNEYSIIGVGIGKCGYEYSLRSIGDKRSHSNRWRRMGLDALILRIKGFLFPGRMLRLEAFPAGVYITHSPTCTCMPVPVVVAGLMMLVLGLMNRYRYRYSRYRYSITGTSIGVSGYEYNLRSIGDKRSQVETLDIALFLSGIVLM